MEVLLDVPRYDFNWQHSYLLAEPRRLAAGTRIRCTAVYDNSSSNPANPNPLATVRAGPQAWDEMFNGYFDVVLADEDLTQPAAWHATLWACSPRITPWVVIAGSVFLLRRRIAAFAAPSDPSVV